MGVTSTGTHVVWLLQGLVKEVSCLGVMPHPSCTCVRWLLGQIASAWVAENNPHLLIHSQVWRPGIWNEGWGGGSKQGVRTAEFLVEMPGWGGKVCVPVSQVLVAPHPLAGGSVLHHWVSSPQPRALSSHPSASFSSCSRPTCTRVAPDLSSHRQSPFGYVRCHIWGDARGHVGALFCPAHGDSGVDLWGRRSAHHSCSRTCVKLCVL